MTKVKTITKTGYGQYTIGSLIDTLQQLIKENEYLSKDSPVFLSDYAMSGYKHEFDLLPTFSPYLKQAGICLFHSLGEEPPIPVVNSQEPVEDIVEEEVTYEEEDTALLEEPIQPYKSDISKFMRFIKG